MAHAFFFSLSVRDSQYFCLHLNRHYLLYFKFVSITRYDLYRCTDDELQLAQNIGSSILTSDKGQCRGPQNILRTTARERSILLGPVDRVVYTCTPHIMRYTGIVWRWGELKLRV